LKIVPASRVADLERTLIRRIFDAAPPDAINLGLGQPDLASPLSVALAGVTAIAHGETAYGSTAGDPVLRASIAETYPGFLAGADDVLITVGSQEAMFVTCLALLDPGDELLYPDPGYPAYPTVARLVGARGVPYPLRADNGFRIDVDEIESRLSERTRAVIVTEPSNPTGAFSERGALERLAGRLEARGVPWISDEIYAGFAYERELVSLSAIAPAGGLVVSGLSKDASMTGWRIGWVATPQAILRRIVAAHQYAVTCASRVCQLAARAAYTDEGRAERRRYLEIFRQRRDLMGAELGKIEGLRFEPPDGAFYYFVDVSRFGDSLTVAKRILERRNVVTIPGVAFGPGGEGFLRLSFAASDEQIREGVRRIAEELATR
jgi:aspartate/methionine/tyrosine aminotransferase